MRSPFLILSLTTLIVSCGDDGRTTPTPATGTIYVMVSGGTGTTSNGYSLTLDGGPPLTMALGTVTLSEVPIGSHLLQLFPPTNCFVGGDNPRTVTVSAEDPAHVFFGITCQRPPGTLQVTTTTSGAAPASYNVLVDGVDQGTVPANGIQTFPNIYAGPRYVTLANVPANCEVEEPNPQLVGFVNGDTTAVSFTITCTSLATS
jgi:hypothetical protein